MQSLHKKTKNKKAVVVLGVILLIIIINPFNIFGFVRGVVITPFEPFLRVAFGSGSYLSQKISMITSIGSMYEQNQQLQNRIIELESQNAKLQNIQKENEALRKELNLLPRERFELLGAHILSHNPTGGNQWIIIDRGKKDGIKEGMVVIISEGILVGRIDMVDNTTSRVQLITNSKSIVNVQTVRTGAKAVARGDHGISLNITDIKKQDDVEVGDIFVTSNIGGELPAYLSVAKILNISSTDDNLFQEAQALPLVDMDDLYFVFIIK
jgi:rod shape-determining protein MreC